MPSHEDVAILTVGCRLNATRVLNQIGSDLKCLQSPGRIASGASRYGEGIGCSSIARSVGGEGSSVRVLSTGLFSHC